MERRGDEPGAGRPERCPTNPRRLPTPDAGPTRRARLEVLKAGLWRFAGQHGGCLPESTAAANLPDKFWVAADPAGMRYRDVPGATVAVGAAPVAVETGLYGPDRLVLLSNGTTRKPGINAIRRAPPGEEAR